MTDAAQPAQPQHPLDAALATILTAMTQWQAQNDPATLTKRVHALLDKNAEQILLKLLGFDNKYDGVWELDHCNGRNGESAAGDYLKKVQQGAIQEWMQQIQLPTMPPAFKKKLEKQIQADYQNRINDQLWRLVRDKADKDLTALVNEATASNTFENYQKTMALLQPKTAEQQ